MFQNITGIKTQDAGLQINLQENRLLLGTPWIHTMTRLHEISHEPLMAMEMGRNTLEPVNFLLENAFLKYFAT